MATKTVNKLTPIRRGDTKIWEFNFLDEANIAQDITDHIFTIALKEIITDPNAKATILKSVVGGPANNNLDDVLNGKLFFTLMASETAKLSIQTYSIGISQSIPSAPENIIRTLLVDEIQVIPDVAIN